MRGLPFNKKGIRGSPPPHYTHPFELWLQTEGSSSSVFSLTLNSNVSDCMRGGGTALEIKLYQKDSGQRWLEDCSPEKELTPQGTS